MALVADTQSTFISVSALERGPRAPIDTTDSIPSQTTLLRVPTIQSYRGTRHSSHVLFPTECRPARPCMIEIRSIVKRATRRSYLAFTSPVNRFPSIRIIGSAQWFPLPRKRGVETPTRLPRRATSGISVDVPLTKRSPTEIRLPSWVPATRVRLISTLEQWKRGSFEIPASSATRRSRVEADYGPGNASVPGSRHER